MHKTPLFIGYSCLIILAVSVFNVKYTVLGYERQLRKVTQDIYQCSEEIHLLQGEWAVLTQPSRLTSLSERYLKMDPAKACSLYPVSFHIEHKAPVEDEPLKFLPPKFSFPQGVNTWIWGSWTRLMAKGSCP